MSRAAAWDSESTVADVDIGSFTLTLVLGPGPHRVPAADRSNAESRGYMPSRRTSATKGSKQLQPALKTAAVTNGPDHQHRAHHTDENVTQNPRSKFEASWVG